VATRIKTPPIDLYKSDFYVWALTQAELLRDGRLQDLDLEHVIEEIEGLAGRVESAVRSHARIIMEHLLKLQHSPARDPRNSWRHTIRVQRQQLEDDLTPALRRGLEGDLERLYARTRRDLADTLRDFGEDDAAKRLPKGCPYTLEQVIGDWLPPDEDTG
jgi:hypothetical protein